MSKLLRALLPLLITCTAHAAAPAPDMCDGPLHTVLQAAAWQGEARAYWLSRGLLQWPGAAREGRFRLYYSQRAALALEGETLRGADGFVELAPTDAALPYALAQRFRFIGAGPVLALAAADQARLPALLRAQLLLVREDADGHVLEATAAQLPGALDDRYAQAALETQLGAAAAADGARLKLWAPTAQSVSACAYADARGKAIARVAMTFDEASGIWSAVLPARAAFYRYAVEVVAPPGLVRNLVTDPYSLSLAADSQRSAVISLDDARAKPAGWDAHATPALAAQTDMAVYELHVRDFSRDDMSVPAAHRGRYLAFTDLQSDGMRHLAGLARAGITDVHLLPVFDFANVPERGCRTPAIPRAAADSEAQQATVAANAAQDCFNWGYEPWHFNAPEGSYASDADDPYRRVREFRQMVMALHGIGLRVGMDMVYNHTTAAGQAANAVLDRIVPGYYHRLDARGRLETSTCCANTATENRMMAQLMIQSAALWARAYRIDSLRFDLMGHQPRSVLETLQAEVHGARGRPVQMIGEGWNFGEVADGARFVQASQLSLAGSGIATFSDRARDALRGGGVGDSAADKAAKQGWISGGAEATGSARAEALRQADLVRVGLAGTLRDYTMSDASGRAVKLKDIDYHGQPAGYASQPGEVVNYVENHDNETLWDILAWKLPSSLPATERMRVQMLGLAAVAFSQGVAYFHAGGELLRSKSLEKNSFDAGDWFNRIDWSGRTNHFGSGLPTAANNRADWELMRPLLRNPLLAPSAADIAAARGMFRDFLRLRSSSTLFRLRDAGEVQRRLRFYNTGPQQDARLIAARLDGKGYAGANFGAVMVFLNAAAETLTLTIGEEKTRAWSLHPLHAAADAADPRAREAQYGGEGRFTIPPRTAVVFVAP